MAKVVKDTAERGLYKDKIHTALYRNTNIRNLLLGDTTGERASVVAKEFRNHVKSHLFVDDTIKETGSYIYYDIVMPEMHNNIKTCQISLFAICHRDILDDYVIDGYYGNRADILSQFIEEALINDDEVNLDFGIGPLNLISVYPYNSRTMYGVNMIFEVPNFR